MIYFDNQKVKTARFVKEVILQLHLIFHVAIKIHTTIEMLLVAYIPVIIIIIIIIIISVSSSSSNTIVVLVIVVVVVVVIAVVA